MLSQSGPIKRMHFLDSLRGVAALIVVVHHFMVFNGKEMEGQVLPSFLNILHFLSGLNVEAILFFFLISGFSIGLAQKGRLIESRAHTNVYLYKRFKRILPIYLIALVLSGLVGLLIHALYKEEYSMTNLLGNLFFLQTSVGATDYWFSPYGNNGPLWSLAYEMFFYIFFPLFSLVLLKLKIYKSKLIVFLLLFFITLLCIFLNKYLTFIPPLAFLSFFVIWWTGFQISVEYLRRSPDFIFWGTLLIICSGLLALSHWIPSTSILEITKACLMASLLYLSLFLNLNLIFRYKNKVKVFVNKVFSPVGHGSYALYALHYPVFILMSYAEITWVYQIIFIFALIIACFYLERSISHKKFKIFALNYMFINHKRIG